MKKVGSLPQNFQMGGHPVSALRGLALFGPIYQLINSRSTPTFIIEGKREGKRGDNLHTVL